ncbi:hypothetical protein HK102_001212 [Quaeritorhiza haematococci]|nr:hypothetical protein HK102_001212 [Quaeritorhiza haematococci]
MDGVQLLFKDFQIRDEAGSIMVAVLFVLSLCWLERVTNYGLELISTKRHELLLQQQRRHRRQGGAGRRRNSLKSRESGAIVGGNGAGGVGGVGMTTSGSNSPLVAAHSMGDETDESEDDNTDIVEESVGGEEGIELSPSSPSSISKHTLQHHRNHHGHGHQYGTRHQRHFLEGWTFVGLKTFLWTLNLSIKYLLMLIVMSFNLPLFFTVVGGLGSAQLLLEWRKER